MSNAKTPVQPTTSSTPAVPSATNSQTSSSSPAVRVPPSAWARGPPPAVVQASSGSSSASPSAPSTPSIPSNSTFGAGSSGANGTGGSSSNTIARDVSLNGTSRSGAASALGGGAGQGKASGSATGSDAGMSNGSSSRKGLAFGVAGSEVRGVPIQAKAIPNHATSNSIAFGTTAHPDAILSSSPAAQPMTGSHLSDSIKTFGSVDASEAAGHGVVGMSGRKTSGGSAAGPANGNGSAAPAAGPAKSKFDVNKLFQGGGGAGSGAGTSSASSPSVGPSTPSSVGVQLPSGQNGMPARPPPQTNNSGLPGVTSPIRQAGHPYAEAQALQAQNPSRGLGGLPQAYGYDPQGRPMSYPQQQHAQPHGNPYGLNPYPQQGQHNPGQGSFRPQNGIKSPQMGHAQPHSPYNPQAAQFRPPGQQQGRQVRGGQQGQGMQSPRMGAQQGQAGAFVVRPPQQPYGSMSPYAQQQQQQYNQQFYPGQQENPYGAYPQQWQGQPFQYGQLPISPRPGQASVGSDSPAPTHSGLPQNPTLGASTTSASSRPPSMGAVGHTNSGFSASSSQHSSVPTTPSMTPARTSSYGGPTFTPSHLQNPSLHASASTFVPRAKSSAIKITREDGTQVDLASAAKVASPASTPVKTPASAATTPAPPTKPVFAPVVVRIETEEQKAARLAEAAKEKKIKDEEEKEAKERKEREVARKAREEKEKADKLESEEKAKADAEAKAKADEERIAQEKVDAEATAEKQKEEKDASVAAKKAEDEAAAKKAADDEAARVAAEEAAASKKAAEDDAAAERTREEESRKASEEGAASKAKTDADSAAASAKQSLPAPLAEASTAAPSPKGSPALGVAGLPAKPTTPAPAPLERKKTAPAGDLSPASVPASPNPSSAAVASAQDIKVARPITNLSSVSYPSDLSAPDPGLNRDSTSGKYRYDRSFLLQFMRVCMERPLDMNNPEDVGMLASADGGSDFGRTQSNRGGARGGGNRNASGLGMGMGGSMGNFGSKPASGGMGGFGTGNFSSGTRGTSSEDRLAASRSATGSSLANARSTSGMARTPSQGGPGGAVMPPSNLRDGSGLRDRENTRIRSQRGTQRGQRDVKSGSMSNIFFPGGIDPNVAPLELSANRWTPAVQNRRPGAIDESSPEYIERKVKALLNKLTEEKFDSISGQILEWANKSANESDGMTLRLVIKLIFEKAKDEQFWSRMYARLCRKLLETVSNDVKDDQLTVNDPKLVGGFLFRKYLLNRCQEDFERGWKAKEDSSAAAKSKAVDDEAKKVQHEEAVAAGKQVEEFKFSDEYYEMAAAKRQGLGLVKFVGELFKLGLLSAKIIATCVQKLLVNVIDPDEEDVESLCQLLSTVGEQLEKHSQQMKGMVGVYLKRLQEMRESDHISSRMKFMLQDVIELQKHQWQARSNQRESGPMTIDEVHQQAAKDAQEAARNAAQQQANARNDPMSRGGSRRGEQRGGMPGANDQWQNVAARLPAKPADMSSFGKIQKSGGPLSLGPQNSVFGKKKGGDSLTPPISRTASSANISSNPFGALAAESEMAAPAPSAEEAPQRRKLVLAPRSKNADSEEPSTPGADDDETEEEAPAVEEASAGLSKSDIERKIKNDRAEFWGEKDIGGTRNPEDIVEYFEGLPADGESRGLLAKAFVEDVFRIVKQKDTSVVVDGFERAVEKGLLTEEVAKQGLASTIETLDDAAIDIPQAYSFAAQLMLACGLSQEAIEGLADTIEMLGEMAKTPKMKLLAEVEKLNKEAEAEA